MNRWLSHVQRKSPNETQKRKMGSEETDIKGNRQKCEKTNQLISSEC